jgi:hypothetical protein
MKTREIEVNVETDWINQTSRIGYISESTKFPTRLNGKETIKAKLIIEIPERKVEITESEFNEAFKFWKTGEFLLTGEGFELAKKKLFGKE